MISAMGTKYGLEFDEPDYKRNILHLSWHPHENLVAIAATNNLYIFSTL